MLEFLLEVVFEIAGEILFAYGAEFVIAPFRREGRSFPGAAIAGIFVFAAIASILVYLVFPRQLLPASPLPGISLIVSPLVSGLALYLLGSWRRAMGKPTTIIATFWGGAFFSFIFAATRFLLVRYS